jgi:sialate O-acetylesterase
MKNSRLFNGLAIWLLTMIAGTSIAAEKKGMPRADVIDVPAVGEGLCVSNVFQTNMVVQRDKPVTIWGWAGPGQKVTVSFANKQQTAAAGKDRSWKVTFPAMPASSVPAKMTVKGKEKTLTLTNILVGDVWVLGGQSNMEFPLSKIENGALEIVSANYKNIRILTIPAQNGPDNKQGFPRLHEWSDWSKRHFRKGDWDTCSPDAAAELSGIGYVFARRVHMASQIPIGVIDASRGGTTVEAWTPNSVLRKIDTPEVKSKLKEWDEQVAEYDPKKDLAERIKRHHDWVARMKKGGKKIPSNRKTPSETRPGPAMNQNRPGNCYASMIAPIAGLKVKGAIFHQGFNNCFDAARGAIMYYQVFGKMITAWRAAFNDPKMPFGILSLCTAGTRQTRDNYVGQMADAGAYIREAQYKTFLDFYHAGDKNIGFVSTYDLRRRWYHPQLKIPAGERIARWALATQYGFSRNIRWKPPMVKEMKIQDGHIVLHMDESVSNVDDGGRIEGFAIAGKDGRYHPADASHLVTGKDSRNRPRKDSKVLVLKSPMVPSPVHYRYAWARNPMGNVQSHHNTDIPLATQRSDKWSLKKTYEALTGKKSKPDGSLDRGQRRELIKALSAEDTRRRLAEAKTLIGETKDK